MLLSNYSTEWCWIYPIYCILLSFTLTTLLPHEDDEILSKNKINLKSRRCMTQKAENNKKLSFDMLILSCNLDLFEYIILSA